MSAPNYEGNPWLPLANLLKIRTPVAKLATAIEKYGIQTYDRFGRRIPATDEDAEVEVSKAYALDLLAGYYDFARNQHLYPPTNTDDWLESDSPLFDFGWPADEAPDFDKIEAEEVPRPPKTKYPDMDAPVGVVRRRSFLTVIAALCETCGLKYNGWGTAQRIKEATETLGNPVDDDTIRSMLKEIPDALEARSK